MERWYVLIVWILLFYGWASMGSFFGVLLEAGRAWERKRIMTGRSKCDHCNKELEFHELIPVVSFVVQKWRCRQCGLHIKQSYLRIEVVFGMFTIVGVYIGGMIYGLPWQEILFWLGILRCLIAISISDIRRYELPLSVWWGGVVRTIARYLGYYKMLWMWDMAIQLTHAWTNIVQFGAVCVGIAAIMYFISHIIVYQKTKVRQAGMWAGDIVLMIWLSVLWFFLPAQSGLVISYNTTKSLVGELFPTWVVDAQFSFLRYVCASVVGVIMWIGMRRYTKRDLPIPFLPALIVWFIIMIAVWSAWSNLLQ